MPSGILNIHSFYLEKNMKTRTRIFTLICTVLLLGMTFISAPTQAQTLVGHWTFEPGSELVDLKGNFSNLTLKGGATITAGALDVGPDAWAQAIGYTGPTITEKTLVSWVRLDALSIPGAGAFSGGSVLTIDKTNADQFDAIVFGEREANRWMAGSNGWSRSSNPVPGFAETTTGVLVQMAITYENFNGTARIKIYRNGSLIGSYDKGPIASWSGSTTEILFGIRHTLGSRAPSKPWVDAQIEEARIYNSVLTQAEIQALTIGGANQAPDCSNASIPDQSADANCSATISGADVTGVTDPDGDPLTITVSPTNLVLGANQVTVTADDGNGGTCSTTITVNVIDDTSPTITCPGDITVQADPGASGAIVTFNVTANDNCSGVTVVCTPASGSTFPLGTTQVNCIATDDAGNTANCSFNVTVEQAPPPSSHGYTLLADRDIFIKELVRADGNMHANNDIRFSDGAPATVNGNLTAVDDIEIQDDNTINGDVSAGDRVELHDETVVNGTVTANANVATVSILSLSFSAGGNDVTVPQNGSMNLAPGSYGKVKVQKGGTLTLNHSGSSGDYFFEKLQVDKNATLSFDANNGPIAVNVVDKLSFGKGTEVVISSPSGSNSRLVTFNSKEGVTVGKGARILGTINAPRDKVKLGKNVSFKGAICAGKIEIDKGGTYLNHDSSAPLPKVVPSAVTDATEEAEKLLEAENAATPTEFVLEQNYPNPFNPSTTIRFSLPEAAGVTLTIYNTSGQRVRTLVSGQMGAGQHSVVWNATDDRGARVASGLYLYTLKAGTVTLQRKLVLMK